MHLNLLRAFLGLGAATWGAALVGVFLSWDTAASALEGLGAKTIAHDPMIDYWFRMASGAFGLIGGLYLLMALWPRRFREMIPWFGWFSLVEGVILGIHGFRLSLSPWPFYGDVGACLLAGVGILVSSRGTLSTFHAYGVEPPERSESAMTTEVQTRNQRRGVAGPDCSAL